MRLQLLICVLVEDLTDVSCRPADCCQTITSRSALRRCRWFGFSVSSTQKGEVSSALPQMFDQLKSTSFTKTFLSDSSCPFCPISIVPIPSSNEEIRLVDDAFGKISHMVSDGSWMVRVQAAKTLVKRNTCPF